MVHKMVYPFTMKLVDVSRKTSLIGFTLQPNDWFLRFVFHVNYFKLNNEGLRSYILRIEIFAICKLSFGYYLFCYYIFILTKPDFEDIFTIFLTCFFPVKFISNFIDDLSQMLAIINLTR